MIPLNATNDDSIRQLRDISYFFIRNITLINITQMNDDIILEINQTYAGRPELQSYLLHIYENFVHNLPNTGKS